METKRARVFKIFKSQPDEAFSIQELSDRTALTKRQVRRVIQFYMDINFIVGARDNYSGIGRKGKIVYYALSNEIHSKLR